VTGWNEFAEIKTFGTSTSFNNFKRLRFPKVMAETNPILDLQVRIF